jgi:hypothetical protein
VEETLKVVSCSFEGVETDLAARMSKISGAISKRTGKASCKRQTKQ